VTSLFVVIFFEKILPRGVKALEVANVTALSHCTSPTSHQVYPPCELKHDSGSLFLIATCPVINSKCCPVMSPTYQPRPNPCWPDIMVTFDYNPFNASAQPGIDALSGAAVWFGVAKNPEDLMRVSPPITLLSDFYLAASYSVSVRRTFSNSAWSFLGIVQAYDTLGVADVVIYGNDPILSTPRKPNTSSLRLFKQTYDWSAARIVQDTPVNSFLHGLSDLGGLYTTANAIFLFVFGFGLAQILGIDRFSLLRGNKRPEESTEQVTEKQE